MAYAYPSFTPLEGAAAELKKLDAKDVLRAFRLRGIAGTLQADAVDGIVRQLRREPDKHGALDKIFNALQEYLVRNPSFNGMIDESVIAGVVADMTRDEDDFRAESIAIVPAFAYPKYTFDSSRRVYHNLGSTFPLHAPAASKVSIMPERLALVQARLSRDARFAPLLPGAAPRTGHWPLTPIDQLPTLAATSTASGGGGTLASVHILGVISQPEEGLWCLEDGHKSVALDLTAAKRLPGLFTETCVVIASGSYEPDAEDEAGGDDGGGYLAESGGHHDADLEDMDVAMAARGGAGAASGGASSSGGRGGGFSSSSSSSAPGSSGAGGAAAAAASRRATAAAMRRFAGSLTDGRIPGVLRVQLLAHPPQEPRGETLKAMDTHDPFGVITTPSELAKVRELEAAPEALANTMVVLSDVWLDKPSTLRALAALFRGFSEEVAVAPFMFVLMGNFCSYPFGQHADDRDTYKQRMDALADVIARFPRLLRDSHFVFVPGHHDPGSARVLPRHPIPAFFTTKLQAVLGPRGATFTTNPARIRYFTQEIVLFRCELSMRLRRRALLAPMPEPPKKEIYEHAVRTIIDQGHLCPLPMSYQPVYWSYDYALRLHPTPDALLMCEDSEAWGPVEYSGSIVANPGPFGVDTSFMCYSPSTRKAESSVVWEGGEEEEEAAAAAAAADDATGGAAAVTGAYDAVAAAAAAAAAAISAASPARGGGARPPAAAGAASRVR